VIKKMLEREWNSALPLYTTAHECVQLAEGLSVHRIFTAVVHGRIALTFYRNSLVIVDLAMGQIPCSTKCISSGFTHSHKHT